MENHLTRLELATIGRCVVSLSQPMGATRFYGPFESGVEAQEWIEKQPEQTQGYLWIVPLRRTDIERTHDAFYNPSLDGFGDDFWS